MSVDRAPYVHVWNTPTMTIRASYGFLFLESKQTISEKLRENAVASKTFGP